jgi:hypothetical protein
MVSMVRIIAGLMIGVKVSPKSTLALYVKRRTTQRAL